MYIYIVTREKRFQGIQERVQGWWGETHVHSTLRTVKKQKHTHCPIQHCDHSQSHSSSWVQGTSIRGDIERCQQSTGEHREIQKRKIRTSEEQHANMALNAVEIHQP